ncbi:hypothetical protein [Bifidobacterium anseris]|uniref:hypothetical protein n=1 Tax=Bifidobacterium anseris TaxID=2020963 RepID=UPI0013FD8722|nr:hypothetical protein [Bifidobacterium anseris]
MTDGGGAWSFWITVEHTGGIVGMPLTIRAEAQMAEGRDRPRVMRIGVIDNDVWR